MPYRVRFQIRQSELDGNGVYTLEDIPKGAICWSFYGLDGKTPNKAYSRQDFESMEAEEVKTILHGGFYFAQADLYVQCLDGGDFTNHSTNPNTRLFRPSTPQLQDLKVYAIRDIKAGQELSEWYPDYFSGESQWVTALLDKYEPQRKKFQWKTKDESPEFPRQLP